MLPSGHLGTCAVHIVQVASCTCLESFVSAVQLEVYLCFGAGINEMDLCPFRLLLNLHFLCSYVVAFTSVGLCMHYPSYVHLSNKHSVALEQMRRFFFRNEPGPLNLNLRNKRKLLPDLNAAPSKLS